MSQAFYKILVVDNDIRICHKFEDLFEEDRQIRLTTCMNPFEALREIKTTRFHMVIADINMPQITGYQLLAEVKKFHPDTQVCLLTSSEVDNYLRIAKEYGITNIITKEAPFKTKQIKTYLYNLIKGNIFGLKNYLNQHQSKVSKLRIEDSDTIQDMVDRIQKKFKEQDIESNLKLPLWEVITNAIYHAPKQGDDTKYQRMEEISEGVFIHHREENVALLPHEKVIVEYGWDEDKYGISVSDPMGSLRTQDVLHYLTRNIVTKDEDIPEGLFDAHGRGFFLIRENVDRMIINIKPGKRTEIIIMNFFDKDNHHFTKKPLFINEV